MIQAVILDLDGPVLDGKRRHYACYSQILRKHGYASVNLDSYWHMKRERVDLGQLLSASGAGMFTEDFRQSWLELIEQPEFLALDGLQPGAREKLLQWRVQRVRLILVTLRRHPERLHRQLTSLGLDVLLDQVVVCEHSRGGLGKGQQLKNEVADISPADCLWVGDTEVDIEAARSFGCPVWAVACGLRSESYLASLSPDFLSEDLTTVDLRCCNGC
jgi:phosphoglycolate phosphatase